MKRRFPFYLVVAFLLLTVVNCAKRGTPTGGEKDNEPPKMTRAIPEEFSTNFDGSEIRIYFDEYIKLKDIQRQLIISPPLKQGGYIVTPQGNASKYIDIKITDTLQPNTTYSFNFGQSVTDNNEGNPYEFFKYIFSTGDYIDSLSVSGLVKDAKEKNPDQFVSVMLYEIDSTYNDSSIYKRPPTYITNTLDSAVTFRLDNLKAGKYMLFALKDEANNYLFNQKTDKVAFAKEVITVPTDSIYELTLFKEETDFKATRPAQVAKSRIAFGYEGSPEDVNIKLLSSAPESFAYAITPDSKADSLNYWFKGVKADSLQFEVSKGDYKKDFTVKLRDMFADTLVLSANQRRVLSLHDRFAIAGSIPLSKKDESYISILNKDSVAVDFTTVINKEKNQLDFDFEVLPNDRYTIQLLPNAIEDFYGNVNDTLFYSLNTKSPADYGNIRVNLSNVSSYPIIIQVVDEQGEVAREIYATESQPEYTFDHLSPAKYYIRVIFDSNKNGKWDTGNYLKKQQPERISYHPQLLDVRANWDLNETVRLKD